MYISFHSYEAYMPNTYRGFLKYIYVIHRLGGPYWEKLYGLGRYSDRGHSMDRPRPVNNLFCFFPTEI